MDWEYIGLISANCTNQGQTQEQVLELYVKVINGVIFYALKLKNGLFYSVKKTKISGGYRGEIALASFQASFIIPVDD